MSGNISTSFGQVIVCQEIDYDVWEYIITIRSGTPTSIQETWFHDGEHEATRQIEPSDAPQWLIEEVEGHMIPKGAFTRSGDPEC